ncbi:cardiolipin synthase [Acidipropionibacterium jensenii]|uniref:cardiolipin synthase n=1 Tax=Acidipropionibacterium jensenii TaxID=1749 RepID=UPI00110C1DFD|nr:cardiolipin synthase [Acidipropionibacterium jensenii]QCV87218.1 cardiolipin synthase [Acidipropionibacterium jensenii]
MKRFLRGTSVFVVIEYLIKVFAIGVVPENRRPSSSTAWLLLILFLPVVGVPLFLMFGSPFVNGRRARIQAEANLLLKKGTDGVPNSPESVTLPQGLADIIELSRSLTSLPMVTGVNHGVTMDYEESIERMTRLVETAQEAVDVEIYIMARDDTTRPFFEALADAVKRGVKVRVLLDHIGSRKYPGFHQLLRDMTAAGIEWYLMLPFLPLQGKVRRIDLRNHRKLLIVDGRVAAMGSQNLIEAPYGSARNARLGRRWVDITIELTGEIVSSLEAIFIVDWYTESGEIVDMHAYRGLGDPDADAHLLPTRHGPRRAVGGNVNAVQLIPSGPGFRTDPNLRTFASLMYLAKHRLAMVSPYFVPDESLLAAVTTAALRGVSVELYVSEVADQFMVDRAQSSYYQALLDAGVRIYRYPAPEVLHTKCFLVDDEIAVMGSSNLDMRSFGLNYEISLLAYGGDIVEQLRDVIADYASRSSVLDPERWSDRSVARRYTESVMRLTSAIQ